MLRSGLMLLYLAPLAPLAPAEPIQPVDVIGTWVLDVPAFQSQVEIVLEEQIGGLPAEERSGAAEVIVDAAAAVVASADSVVEFRADGIVLFRTGERVDEAVWGIDEATLRLVRRQAGPGDVPINGTFEEGLLYLEPDRAGHIVLPLPLRRQ